MCVSYCCRMFLPQKRVYLVNFPLKEFSRFQSLKEKPSEKHTRNTPVSHEYANTRSSWWFPTFCCLVPGLVYENTWDSTYSRCKMSIKNCLFVGKYTSTKYTCWILQPLTVFVSLMLVQALMLVKMGRLHLQKIEVWPGAWLWSCKGESQGVLVDACINFSWMTWMLFISSLLMAVSNRPERPQSQKSKSNLFIDDPKLSPNIIEITWKSHRFDLFTSPHTPDAGLQEFHCRDQVFHLRQLVDARQQMGGTTFPC